MMKPPKSNPQVCGWLILVAIVALWFGTPMRARAVGDTNYTQAILDTPSFPEGLIWIGTNEPSAEESAFLWNIVTNLNDLSWRYSMDEFLLAYPDSPWAASVHHAYASSCRRTGQMTKALNHWALGWSLASTNVGEARGLIGGDILGNWMELLASLGRIEQVGELVGLGEQWAFGNPRHREKFQAAKESFRLMGLYPGGAFRCGTLAVKAVGQALQPTNAALESLVDVQSPTNGFSVAQLLTEGNGRGLEIVAVRRPWEDTNLVVPSVIHWQQNHYAAILEQDTNGFYRINDPTFGGATWLTQEQINEEASGVFLVASNSVPEGWEELDSGEAESIRGMGQPNNVRDRKDKGKPDPCKNGRGMPFWWVTEPYVNLWIADEPFAYLTSRGEAMTFRVNYKQRDPEPEGGSHTFLMPRTGWNNNWSSYVRVRATYPCGLSGCTTVAWQWATVYEPGGGEVGFTAPTLYNPAGSLYDAASGLHLDEMYPIINANDLFFFPANDDGLHGFRVFHADGSQDIYGFPLGSGSQDGAPVFDFWLTRRIDPHGNVTRFVYEVGTFMQHNAYRLRSVVDCDGKTNRLVYDANWMLIAVTNSDGLAARFTYDSKGNLTNIVDAAGLSSSVAYDTNGYPSSLTTPYGTTLFEYTEAATNTVAGNFGGHDLVNRAVKITEPGGATSLYLYRYDSPAMATTYPANDIPTNTPFGTLDDGSGATNNLGAVSFRNSFYWNPRQFAALSTNDPANLTTNDFVRGRMRHWLQDTNELYLSESLSVERDPSPDGTGEGVKVFYDYAGKIYRHREGTNAVPAVTAWRFPGGETHYGFTRYNEFGTLTNEVTTYSKADGSLATRTNQYTYIANTYTNILQHAPSGSLTNRLAIPNLLSRVVAADGSNVWSFGGYEPVSWTNGDALCRSLRVLPRYLTNAAGEMTELGFTGSNRISQIKFASGLTRTNIYDSGGFLSKTIDLQVGRTNSFAYTTNGMPSSVTNALGLALSPVWDGLLRLTKLGFADGSYISNRWDKLDVVGRRDRMGSWSYFSYDGLDHLVSSTNANTNITRFGWCGCGTLESVSNALNQITTLTHDYQMRCTGIQWPDTSSVTYQYDLAGRVTNVLDGLGRSLKYKYNNQGLVTAVSNAYGRVVGVVYDIRDRPIQVTDATGLTVTNVFDNRDRIIARLWPSGGGNEGWLWTTNGLLAYTNRNNKTTRLVHDAAGRLIAVTNANSEPVQLGYNPAGQITNLLDGLNHKTRWSRNEFGWVTNKVDALNREAFRFGYDLNGRLTNRWTPEFGNAAYLRDPVGNVTAINYPGSAINYSYDALNRLTNMVDAVGTTKFIWTDGGQVASEDGPWANDTVSYGYSQRLRSSVSINSAFDVSYNYDSAWRLTELISPAGTFDYSYEANSAASLIRTVSLPNLAMITNHFDSLERLDYRALVNKWGHVLDGYGYLHDTLGLRTNVIRDFGLATNSVSILYDDIGQVILWSAKEHDGTLRQNEQFAWDYDGADNLWRRTNGGLAQTFIVDAANQLTNVTRTGTLTVSGNTPSAATNISVNGISAERYEDFTFASTNYALSDGNNTFTNIARNSLGQAVTNVLTVSLPASVLVQFDSNGNLTNDGVRSLFYNAEGELTNVTIPNAFRAEFVYDGLRRLRIEREYRWASGWVLTNEVRHVYDGPLSVQERNGTNALLVTQTRGLDLRSSLRRAGGIGGLLARTSATGASSFYHSDGSGNITAVMDTDENVSARYLYNPYGRLIGQWGPIAGANRYGYSSKERIAQSGLYDFGMRRYDTDLQRWTSQDPLREAGGINLYRFVRNNPQRFIDPYGLGVEPGSGPLESIIGGLVAGLIELGGVLVDLSVDARMGNADSTPLPLYQNGLNLDGLRPVPQPDPFPMSEPSTLSILGLYGGLYLPLSPIKLPGGKFAPGCRRIGRPPTPKGLPYLNEAYDTGKRITALIDQKTGEVAFGPRHGSAYDLMESSDPILNMTHAEYEPGVGWQVYHDDPGVKAAAESILNGFLP